MSQRPAGRSRFETRAHVCPDDNSVVNFWLNDGGNRALRFLHLNGACRDLGPDSFYPEKGHSAQAAYRVCGDCEVRAACLAFALSTTERLGVWGGTNETARRPLMRRVAAGESPDDVAADHCQANPVRHRGFGGRRFRYPEEIRAEAVRLCLEAGPGIALNERACPHRRSRAGPPRRKVTQV